MSETFTEDYFEKLMKPIENSRYSSITLNINRPNYSESPEREIHYESRSGIYEFYSRNRDRISNYLNNI